MLSAFDVVLLIVSLAGYVFLFLKLKEAAQTNSALGERLDRLSRAVERLNETPAAAVVDDAPTLGAD